MSYGPAINYLVYVKRNSQARRGRKPRESLKIPRQNLLSLVKAEIL